MGVAGEPIEPSSATQVTSHIDGRYDLSVSALCAEDGGSRCRGAQGTQRH